MTKRQLTHICTECLEEFSAKNIYIASFKNGDFSTMYCKKCIDELKIKEFIPYNKPRKKKSG
jgi:hypothetical protein